MRNWSSFFRSLLAWMWLFPVSLSAQAAVSKSVSPTQVEHNQLATVNIQVQGYSEQSSTPVPYDAVIVIDQSASMSMNDPGGDRITAALHFVDIVAANVRIAVVRFSNEATLVQSLTADKNLLRSKIGPLYLGTLGSETNIAEAMELAQEQFSGAGIQATRAVIFLTDGAPSPDPDDQTAKIYSELLPAAIQEGIRYYTISVGTLVDWALLNSVAAMTDGIFVQSPTSTQLNSAYDQINASISSALVTNQIVLRERLDPRLKVEPGSLSVSGGVIQPSASDILAFESGGSIDLRLGEMSQVELEAISFKVSAPDCLAPDAAQASVDIGVDHTSSRLDYVWGTVVKSDAIPQATLKCLKPGVVTVTKKIEPSTQTVTISVKNNYQTTAQDRTVRDLLLREYPSSLMLADVSSVSVQTAANESARFFFFGRRLTDGLFVKSPSLAPQSEFRMSFALRVGACSPGDTPPLGVDASKRYGDAESLVYFTLHDGTRKYVKVPQATFSPQAIESCPGRPDYHVEPAWTEREFFSTTGDNPLGLAPQREESRKLWIDGPANGLVTNWESSADVQAHLRGGRIVNGGLVVTGQGDEFDPTVENLLYLEVANATQFAPATPTDAMLQILNPTTGTYSLIDKASIMVAGGQVGRIRISIPQGTVTGSHVIAEYGLSLRQLRGLINGIGTGANTIGTFLTAHPEIVAQLDDKPTVLPSDVLAVLPLQLRNILQQKLNSTPSLKKQWVRRAVTLSVGISGVGIETHVNDNFATEAVILTP